MCPPADYYNYIRAENKKAEIRRHMAMVAEQESKADAARRFGTTWKTVDTWHGRWKRGQSLQDRSRAPHSCPHRTDRRTERKVIEMRRKTGYGPHRLRDMLKRTADISISQWTVRNILDRHDLTEDRQRRQDCYPAHWAWETGEPLGHIQADLKDVRDEDTLGTELTTHLDRAGLPRYQWTFQDSQSRMRLLAYSHRKTISCGLSFLTLCVDWLRSWSVDMAETMQIQTDWGEEFGGGSPRKLERLNQKYFYHRGAELCRYPKGRKRYNGRVERSHRSDDEELYMPLLRQAQGPEDLLDYAFQWQAYYNLHRPHYGEDMGGKTPIQKLGSMGVEAPDEIALMPPIILDRIIGHNTVPGTYDVVAKYRYGWSQGFGIYSSPAFQ